MKLRFPTAFSVDFSETVETKSYSFQLFLKKLPLEALGITVSQLLHSGSFCQKCRLGPPELSAGSDPSCQKLRKAEIPSEKQ